MTMDWTVFTWAENYGKNHTWPTILDSLVSRPSWSSAHNTHRIFKERTCLGYVQAHREIRWNLLSIRTSRMNEIHGASDRAHRWSSVSSVSLPLFPLQKSNLRTGAGIVRDGLIELFSSAWSSPTVMAKKRNGNFQFCVDFRRLNSVTKDTAQTLSIIHKVIKDLGTAKVFSQIDLLPGYWQFGLETASRPPTHSQRQMGATFNKRLCALV